MDSQYYIEYFTLERTHWWFKVREKIIEDKIKDFINQKNELNILNVGAATGRTTEMLSRFGKVTSVEFDQSCCDFTSEKLGIPIINASILDLPFEAPSFDLVCAFDVIEHVSDDSKAVSELKRVCKPGGIICLTVPAFMQLWSHHDEVNQHFRRYLMKDIIRLFKEQQGTILYKSYFNSLLFLPVLSFRLLSGLLPEKFIRKGAGSDFTVVNNDSLINKIFYYIFNFERFLLHKISFPAGVSLIFLWKNN